jgi:hypothetical protein
MAPFASAGAAAARVTPPAAADPRPSTRWRCLRQGAAGVPRRVDIPIIFDDFSAIPPQWPFDRVSFDIFVIA